jgi:hypothetical protein
MIGRFYFKRTRTGNLIGEFSNNFSSNNPSQSVIQTESADAINITTDFVGICRSTWNEGNAINSRLTISFKPRTNNRIYTLLWEENGIPIFWSEAMLFEDILIGDYRDMQRVP